MKQCPTCASTNPAYRQEFHHGVEVSICSDPWHTGSPPDLTQMVAACTTKLVIGREAELNTPTLQQHAIFGLLCVVVEYGKRAGFSHDRVLGLLSAAYRVCEKVS